MKTTKEMIEVMQGYADGKEIEVCNPLGLWETDNNPYWNWFMRDYRIKPKSKTRPMTFEEIINYWKQHRTEIFTIIHKDINEDNEDVFITGVNYEDKTIYFGKYDYDDDDVYRFVRKEDGSKFEIEVKNENN